jgi:phosphatidylinositol alpha-1,6-mannosyltransferase
LVVANSEYTAQLVRESAPDANVAAIPLGVDHRFFAPSDPEAAKRQFQVSGKYVISSVSRLQGYKGLDVVLDALAALPLDVRSKFVYLIAGKGPARPALEAKARELGVASMVRWLGWIGDEELREVYRASNLFVLCTRELPARQQVEGFGLVFLEAQACGTPVVGTEAGGIPDAIKSGEGGWLIPQDDAPALARILNALAEEPDRFLLAGKAARARVERECTWDAYFDRLTQTLRTRGLLRDDDSGGGHAPLS